MYPCVCSTSRNDARDRQHAWYVQGTVVSPWIVQLEALEPFTCMACEQVPVPLPYLRDDSRRTFDVVMSVTIQPGDCEEEYLVSKARFRDVYWTFEQMLSHHTVSGCNIAAGDIIASGTVSSEGPQAQGCLLEITKNGKEPLQLAAGCTRTWLQNGDIVRMRAKAENGRARVGFGPCSMTVSPAIRYTT
jgi:fumarylacetoacetase